MIYEKLSYGQFCQAHYASKSSGWGPIQWSLPIGKEISRDKKANSINLIPQYCGVTLILL